MLICSKEAGLPLKIIILQLIKKDKTLKYEVLIAFKGQMSSNISNLFIFKSKVHFPYIYKV